MVVLSVVIILCVSLMSFVLCIVCFHCVCLPFCLCHHCISLSLGHQLIATQLVQRVSSLVLEMNVFVNDL